MVVDEPVIEAPEADLGHYLDESRPLLGDPLPNNDWWAADNAAALGLTEALAPEVPEMEIPEVGAAGLKHPSLRHPSLRHPQQSKNRLWIPRLPGLRLQPPRLQPSITCVDGAWLVRAPHRARPMRVQSKVTLPTN
ncbi:MAG: hypothetical protein V9E81_11400 [Marmoricola sp.]